MRSSSVIGRRGELPVRPTLRSGLVFALVLASTLLGGAGLPVAPASAAAAPPAWTEIVPAPTDRFLFFVGTAEEDRLDLAVEAASTIALKQVVEFIGVRMVSDYTSVRTSLERYARDSLQSRAATPGAVSGLRRLEVHSEQTPNGYRAAVLLEASRAELDRLCAIVREEDELRRKALSEFIAGAVARLDLPSAPDGGFRVVAVDFQEATRGRTGPLGAFLRASVTDELSSRVRVSAVRTIGPDSIAWLASRLDVPLTDLPARAGELLEDAAESYVVVAGTYARSGPDKVEITIRLHAAGRRSRSARVRVPADKLPPLAWAIPSWLPRNVSAERLQQVIDDLLATDSIVLDPLVRRARAALHGSGGTPRRTLDRAADALRNGRALTALQLSDALARMPGAGAARNDVLTLRAIISVRAGRPPAESLDDFEQILAFGNTGPAAALGAAACWLRLGRSDMAFERLERLGEFAGR